MKTSYVKDGIVTCGECTATRVHDFDHAEMECGTCHAITRVQPETAAIAEEIWVTEVGEKIAVGDMSDIHARNTLRMLINQIRRNKVGNLSFHRQQLNGEQARCRVEDQANTISDLLNDFNFKPSSVAKVLMKDHRTIQQSIARFCVVYLEELAKKEIGRDTDPRNEDSVKVAKAFVEAVPNRYLPFV